jgi:hypothetical protein
MRTALSYLYRSAKGFDVSFKPRFELTGRNSVDLRDQWATEPDAYLSMFATNMPNYAGKFRSQSILSNRAHIWYIVSNHGPRCSKRARFVAAFDRARFGLPHTSGVPKSLAEPSSVLIL